MRTEKGALGRGAVRSGIHGRILSLLKGVLYSTFGVVLGACATNPRPPTALVVTDIQSRKSTFEGSSGQIGSMNGFAAQVVVSDLGLLIEVDGLELAHMYLYAEPKTGAVNTWSGWGATASKAGIHYIAKRSGDTLTVALRDGSNATVLTTTGSLGVFNESRTIGSTSREVFIETQKSETSTVFGIDHAGRVRRIASGSWRSGPISPDGQFLLLVGGGPYFGPDEVSVIRLADATKVGTFPSEILTPDGNRAFLGTDTIYWTASTAFGGFATGPLTEGKTGLYVAPLLFNNGLPIGFSEATRIGPQGSYQAKFGTSQNGQVPTVVVRNFDSPEFWIGSCSLVNKTPKSCRQDKHYSRFIDTPRRYSLIPLLQP